MKVKHIIQVLILISILLMAVILVMGEQQSVSHKHGWNWSLSQYKYISAYGLTSLATYPSHDEIWMRTYLVNNSVDKLVSSYRLYQDSGGCSNNAHLLSWNKKVCKFQGNNGDEWCETSDDADGQPFIINVITGYPYDVVNKHVVISTFNSPYGSPEQSKSKFFSSKSGSNSNVIAYKGTIFTCTANIPEDPD